MIRLNGRVRRRVALRPSIDHLEGRASATDLSGGALFAAGPWTARRASRPYDAAILEQAASMGLSTPHVLTVSVDGGDGHVRSDPVDDSPGDPQQDSTRSMWMAPVDDPPPLPARKEGEKTTGVLRVAGQPDKTFESGLEGPAKNMPKGSPGFDIVTRTHVEGHVSAWMRQQNITSGTLYINNDPCSSCDKYLPKMLPPGGSLKVVGPTATKTYTNTGSQRPMAAIAQGTMGTDTMSASFHFQSADGTSTPVTSTQQINDTLMQLGAQDDPNIDLIQEGVGTLSISVKGGFALLRSQSASLDPPYFSASVGTPVVPPSSLDANGNFNFLVGDTPTPVPSDRGVPIGTAVQVAQYYYGTGNLSPNVQWIED